MADEITLDDYLLTHAKEAYDYQLQFTEKLRDRFGLLITQLSLVGGGVLWLVGNYPSGAPDLAQAGFIACLIAAISLFLAGMVILIGVMGGHVPYRYDVGPDPTRLQPFVGAELQARAALPADERKKKVLRLVRAFMLNAYRQAAATNKRINVRRGFWLTTAQQCACMAFVAVVLGVGVSLQTRQHQAPEPPPLKVQIVTPSHSQP